MKFTYFVCGFHSAIALVSIGIHYAAGFAFFGALALISLAWARYGAK